MEQPSSHDLSEYNPINLSALKDIEMGSYEKKLQAEGWHCVRLYGYREDEIAAAKKDVAKIQEAGGEAQITYYDAEREGKLWGDYNPLNIGPRVWMKLS